MSNRLAIDPSEIKISDPRGVRARLWSRSPSPFAADDAPVVKVVEVDFGFNTPVEPRKTAALVVIDRRKAAAEAARKREKAETIRRNDALIDEWLSRHEDRIIETSPRVIIGLIADKYRVSIEDVLGTSTKVRHVMPRQEVMYEIRQKNPSLNSSQIGSLLGNRDATTIRHGVEAHAKRHGLAVPMSAYARPRKRHARADDGLQPVVRS